MVEKAKILSMAESIEGHSWAQEEEPEGNAIWKDREYGAKFEFSKPQGVVFEDQGEISTYLLKLMGKMAGRDRLKQEFIDALGEPTLEFPPVKFRSHLIMWKTPPEQQ